MAMRTSAGGVSASNVGRGLRPKKAQLKQRNGRRRGKHAHRAEADI